MDGSVEIVVKVALISCLTVALIGCPGFMLYALYRKDRLVDMILSKPTAFLGVPFIGGASFIVVLTLRATSGDIEFSVAGLVFKGASGPIVLWCLAYLSMCIGAAILCKSAK